MGDGPLSGEGETWCPGEDSSVLGERLWMGEQLSLPGENALGDAFQPRRENSALLLPGEEARRPGHTPLGAGSGPGPASSRSGVPCWECRLQLERPPVDGCVSDEQDEGGSSWDAASSSSSSSSSLSSSSSDSSTSENWCSSCSSEPQAPRSSLPAVSEETVQHLV